MLTGHIHDSGDVVLCSVCSRVFVVSNTSIFFSLLSSLSSLPSLSQLFMRLVNIQHNNNKWSIVPIEMCQQSLKIIGLLDYCMILLQHVDCFACCSLVGFLTEMRQLSVSARMTALPNREGHRVSTAAIRSLILGPHLHSLSHFA